MSAVEVAYTVEGAGPPLYLVHGIGSRRAAWNSLVADLKAELELERGRAAAARALNGSDF